MGKRALTPARKAANSRYIAEKTETVQAHLPKGYNDKLNKIAELQSTSKAQVLKNAIDMYYNKIIDNE